MRGSMKAKDCCIYVAPFLIAALYFLVMLNRPVDVSCLMPFRCKYLQLALEKFGPGIETAHLFDGHMSKFVYWALFGKLFNISESHMAIYVFELIMWYIAIVFFSIYVYKCFFSQKIKNFFICLFLSCLILLPSITFISDDKYMYAWSIVVGFPVLFSALKCSDMRERMRNVILLFFICGVADGMRIFASFPILLPSIALFLTCVFSFWKNERRIAISVRALLVCLFLKFLFTDLIPLSVGLFYNLFCGGNVRLAHFYNSSGWITPFHQLLISLGWNNSTFGVVYSDDFALQFDDIDSVKNSFFELIKEHPFMFLLLIIKKGLYGFYISFSRIKIYFLLSLILMVFFAVKRDLLNFIKNFPYKLVLTVVYGLSLVPAVIDIPKEQTVIGATALVSLVIFYIIIYAIDKYLMKGGLLCAEYADLQK